MKHVSVFKFYLFVILQEDFIVCSSVNLKIATYNVWNIMFNWNIRKLRQAEMIKNVFPDIVAFQELRGNGTESKSQLQELHALLPQYAFTAYHSAYAVTPVLGVYNLPWNMEGIGVLSRYAIKQQHVQQLSQYSTIDHNSRSVLHMLIEPLPGVPIHVVVVHLTTDPSFQCCQLFNLMKYLQDNRWSNSIIILGDFNLFPNHIEAEQLLLDISAVPRSSVVTCCQLSNIDTSWTSVQENMTRYTDVWKELYPQENGFTFSNMPEPGLQSRPDRIYTSRNIKPVAAGLSGTGQTYQERFYFHIVITRIANLWRSLRDSYKGVHGRPCWQDCGPHASCRCGVCVAGSDSECCNLPDCEECGPTVYLTLVVFLMVFLVLVALFVCSVIRVGQAMNYATKKSVLPCCQWFCIFDEIMFNNSVASGRKGSKRTYCMFCLRIPPMILLLFTALCLTVFIKLFFIIFQRLISDVFAILPEEFFPSDHLLLFAELQISS